MIVYQALRWYWSLKSDFDDSHYNNCEKIGGLETDEIEKLNEKFEVACTRVRESMDRLSPSCALQLYGLYKRATAGIADSLNQPSRFDLMKRRRFDAWVSVSHLTRNAAKERYIFIVEQLLGPVNESVSEYEKVSFGLKPSVPLQSDTESEDSLIGESLTAETKDWFKAVYRQDVNRLSELLKLNPHLTNMKDVNSLTALHHAADRGDLDLMNFLLCHKADINCLDNEGQTPLHYAAECGHKDAVAVLLKAGADPAIATYEGMCPLDVTDNPSIRRFLESVLV